jgi:hypothetical protein
VEAIFYFTPKQSPNLRDKLSDLISNEDFIKYLTENHGVEIKVSMKPRAKDSDKVQMYAYYHGPLLDVAVNMFTDMGYECMDKIKADYLLKSECAVSTMVKDGEEMPYLEDKAAMDKKRLLKYIGDCIFFLESHGYTTPDSDTYKNMIQYGRSYKTAKSFNDKL